MSQIQALIGETLGNKYPYRIESVLGSGAMGVVYKATDLNKNRPAAVKVVGGEIAHGGKVQRRFEREAEILQQFKHPNIVKFLGYGKYRGTYYIAMEFIQGTTLERMLTETGPLTWREVVELAVKIGEALQYAHERGVIHRDLKPSNLMVTEDRKVKLTDFGIAKDLDRTSLTATGRTLGTAAYMSPEQIRGTPAVSHKTDLYAMGVVLYQMLTGRAPFEGASPVVLMHCHLNEPVPRPRDKVHEIPRALDDLVVALMAKAPADRPWDAAAVVLVLNELREKADRGEKIPMAWPSGKGGAGGETTDMPRPKKKTRKLTILSSLTGSFLTSKPRALRTGEVDEVESRRVGLETILLVAALLAVGALIAYIVWPPGQEYLYKRAEALMASEERHDWVTARDEYLEPLDRRFPQNPYREQTAKWRDRILLDEAVSRSELLTAPVKTKFGEPINQPERLYVIAHAVAEEASKRGDDITAAQKWREFAGNLRPNDPEEHKWQLMALRQAEKLEATIQDRRRLVEEQMRIANQAEQAGRTAEAQTIRKKLVEQYSRYIDLADLFPRPSQSDEPTRAASPGAGDRGEIKQPAGDPR